MILRQFEAYRGRAWVFTWYDTILYKELEGLLSCGAPGTTPPRTQKEEREAWLEMYL